jgi:rSAM/selenodomain-associated transferase 1
LIVNQQQNIGVAYPARVYAFAAMRKESTIGVVIPALNEEKSIGKVLTAIPGWVDTIVVADNGSTDDTAREARERGATVVSEPRRGYGAACLAGIAALDDPDVVVFLDGDYSDHPEEMDLLVDPILDDQADMVAGSRVLGRREAGALTPQARFGNWLSCSLIRILWGSRYTDLGPFRAIRRSTLKGLRMQDPNYGWVVEMQIKATLGPSKVLEVPVRYRRRIGRSKVSGTIRGAVGAGTKILWTIFRASLGQLQYRKRVPESHRVIQFTRYPEPGTAKTRLIPELGPDGAADLHRQLSEYTLKQVGFLQQKTAISVEIRYTGGDRERMQDWLGPARPIRGQGGGDLGARMARAFHDAFQECCGRVILVGSDCPGLSHDLMSRALEHLSRCDAVIGPAKDGGYYLIGLRRDAPALFRGISWGTGRVLAQTLARAQQLGLSKALLEELYDIDRPEDLHLWQRSRREIR